MRVERYKTRKGERTPYAWRCPGCRKWRAMDDGAADDLPHLCDRCWGKHHRASERRQLIKARNLRRLVPRKTKRTCP